MATVDQLNAKLDELAAAQVAQAGRLAAAAVPDASIAKVQGVIDALNAEQPSPPPAA